MVRHFQYRRYFIASVTIVAVAVSGLKAALGVVLTGDGATPGLLRLPGVVLFKATDAYCSATIVGRKVLLTAAHCVRDQTSKTATMTAAEGGKIEYQIACTPHPNFATDVEADFALCQTDQPLRATRIERVNSDPNLVTSGTRLMLAGFGCRDPITRVFDGQLSTGNASVDPATRSNSVWTLLSGAAACPGDGGGAAFYRGSGSPDFGPLVGVISRGDGNRATLVSTTSKDVFLRWAKEWQRSHSAICGLDPDEVAACSPAAEGLSGLVLTQFVRRSTGVEIAAAPVSTAAVAFRQPTGLTPSEVQQITYRKGETVAAVVQISCLGTADDAYLDRALAYIARQGTSLTRDYVFTEAGSLTIPVCPSAPADGIETLSVEVTKNGPKKLWYYFRRLAETGKLRSRWDFEYRESEGPRISPTGRQSHYFAEVFKLLNPSQDPAALTPGIIILPLRPQSTTTLDQPVASTDVLEPLQALQSSDESCSKRQDDLTYPYDLPGLLDTLAGNASTRATRAVGEGARIVIIDSGLYAVRREDTIFNGVLHFDRSYVSKESKQLRIDQLEPRLPVAEDAAHGTWVASTALGGPLFARIGAAAGTGEPRIRLDPYRLQESRGGQVVMPANKFPDIFRNLNPRGTVVVNLSLRTANSLSPVFDRLGDKGPNFLFVVAAGNGNAAHIGQVLKPGGTVIPAIYGGVDNDGQANLIAVAALYKTDDGLWKRASFSDYSPDYVEIGAPGCAIPAVHYNRDDESWRELSQYVDGTSFSAPLVSFVAALISAENPELDAASIKGRILAGADLNPGLVNEIADGRSLNVRKAVAIFQDVLESDGQVMRGTLRLTNAGTGTPYVLTDPLPIACAGLGGIPINYGDVLKIVPSFNKAIGGPDADQYPDRVYALRGGKRQLKMLNCTISDEIVVSFNRQGTMGSPEYKWKTIRDLVPRLR